MANEKEIIFGSQARLYLSEGVTQVCDVAAVTFGPLGSYVGLPIGYSSPVVTRDGYTSTKELEFANQCNNLGASMAKEVASKMSTEVGDGTTATLLLTRSLVQNGIKNIEAGASPIDLKRGIEKAVDLVIAELEKLSIPVKNDEEIKNIAIASASGNEEIGLIIASAFKKTGKEGVITIEEGKTTETTVDIVEGMQIDRGYVSSYFCTDSEKLLVEMHDVKILVTDKKISSTQDILPLLQTTSSLGQSLLIIADDIEGEVLSTLVVNRLRGTLKVCAIKAPAFGDKRKALLEDIAILTGAKVVSEETGQNLKDASGDVLGECQKIIISKDKSVFISGKGSQETLQNRISQLQNQIKETKSTYDKSSLEERKAKLSGGVAVIHVGASTEVELKKKKKDFEDSLNSTKASLEGIVPGGGVALFRASAALKAATFKQDELTGSRIVLKALEAPLRQLALNSKVDGSLILAEVLAKGGNFGFNAKTGKVEDLVQAGVVDATKVIKNSLKLAASLSATLLLTEALIVDHEEEKEAAK